MKTSLQLFLTINVFIFLSSCASQNQKLSKTELVEIIKTKLDNRNFRINFALRNTLRDDYGYCIPEYIQVCGDSVISCTTDDNPYKANMPKKYIEQMQAVKYKMFNYKQTEIRPGVIKISFWYQIKYDGEEITLLTKYPDRLLPVGYTFIFRNSTKVRIEKDLRNVNSTGPLAFFYGTLSLP